MASMTRKLQELEQQLQAQNDEMLSKVGPGSGRTVPPVELAVGMASRDLGMILVPRS
jgi:hypothetical protein